MRLDRYIGEKPKFRVFRRVDGPPIFERAPHHVIQDDEGTYVEVPPFDYFVLALKDWFTPSALEAYAKAARFHGEQETAEDVYRLGQEAVDRPDRKIPD